MDSIAKEPDKISIIFFSKMSTVKEKHNITLEPVVHRCGKTPNVVHELYNLRKL